MSAGHVGKWLIRTQNGVLVPESDLQAIEKMGYEIVCVTAFNHPGRSTIYARYRGGVRAPASR